MDTHDPELTKAMERARHLRIALAYVAEEAQPDDEHLNALRDEIEAADAELDRLKKR
jgi:hypothetical protein